MEHIAITLLGLGLDSKVVCAASAVVIAREAGVGLKVIWREEVECGVMCGSMPPFNSSWEDLFSYPKLRLAPNFPGKLSSFKYYLLSSCAH